MKGLKRMAWLALPLSSAEESWKSGEGKGRGGNMWDLEGEGA